MSENQTQQQPSGDKNPAPEQQQRPASDSQTYHTDDGKVPKNQQDGGWSLPSLSRPKVGTASGSGGGAMGGGIGVMDLPREFLSQMGDTMQYKEEELMQAYEKWKNQEG